MRSIQWIDALAPQYNPATYDTMVCIELRKRDDFSYLLSGLDALPEGSRKQIVVIERDLLLGPYELTQLSLRGVRDLVNSDDPDSIMRSIDLLL